MKKIIITLASVALLAGCSADGVFGGGTLQNPNVIWSNDDNPNLPSNTQYCYYYDDEYDYHYVCDLIGGLYTSSVAACNSKDGEVISRQACINNKGLNENYIYDY